MDRFRQDFRNRPLTDKTDWVHRLCAEEIVDRRALVMRDFPRALLAGRLSPAVAATLRTLAPEVEEEPHGPAFNLAVALPDLTFENDPVAALSALRATLLPDGLLLAAVFCDGTLQELRDTLMEVESDLSGGAALRVAPFASTRVWGDALAKAGFALPVADAMRLTVRYASMDALIKEARALYGRGLLLGTRPAPRRLFERAAGVYAARHGDRDGRVRATLSLAFLSGWAPDPSQQKPAKRGSGTVSLADALAPGAAPQSRPKGPPR
ncbi:MAG: SAM-dependent methyltransferase [Pseudomonadota bacterium]